MSDEKKVLDIRDHQFDQALVLTMSQVAEAIEDYLQMKATIGKNDKITISIINGKCFVEVH
tara:strand:- start:101 stop:283 length:183 start_codon:yes stop_codon:yes gene_type:complete